MKFQYEIPDEKAPALFEAFCGSYGYEETIKNDEGEDVPNPVSAAEFTLNCVQKFLNDVVDGWNARKAQEEAAKKIAEEKAKAGDSGVQITVVG